MGEGDTGGDSGWALRLRGNSLLRVYREDMVPLRRTPRSAQRQRHGSRRGLSGLRAGPQPAATPPGLSLRNFCGGLCPGRARVSAPDDGRRRPGRVVGAAAQTSWAGVLPGGGDAGPREPHRLRGAGRLRSGRDESRPSDAGTGTHAREPRCVRTRRGGRSARPPPQRPPEPSRAPSPPSCRHSRPDSLSGMLERGQGQRLTFSSQAGCHLQATCRRKGRGRLPGSPSAGPSAHVPDREDGALPAAGL